MSSDRSTTEPPRELPALYMVWDHDVPRRSAAPSAGYDVSAVPNERADTMRAVVELDGAVTDRQWASFVERILPDGLFAASVSATSQVIGTVSSVHNPSGARFYFPGGGAIGYLVVSPEHRGRGLGLALVTAAVNRLRSAGYRTIWVGVEGSRSAAIRTYLSAGFVPLLHAPDPDALAARWHAIFSRLSRVPDVSTWRRELPTHA